MDEVDTIHFTDADSQDDAVVLVRAGRNAVALAISLRTDGDIEAVLDRATAERLLVALRAAIVRAGSA